MSNLNATTGSGTHDNSEQKRRRAGAAAFLRESVQELKRVRWPRRKEVATYTIAALLTCLVMGALVWAFDVGVHAAIGLLGIHE